MEKPPLDLNNLPPILTTADVCKLGQFSLRSFSRMRAAGEWPVARCPGRRRQLAWPRDEVLRALRIEVGGAGSAAALLAAAAAAEEAEEVEVIRSNTVSHAGIEWRMIAENPRYPRKYTLGLTPPAWFMEKTGLSSHPTATKKKPDLKLVEPISGSTLPRPPKTQRRG